MGIVNNSTYGEGVLGEHEFPQDPDISRIRVAKRKKRLALLFGDPNFTVDSVVTPVGEKEMEQDVRRLKEEQHMLMRKDDAALATEELEKEVMKSKAEFKEVMKEMNSMRQQQVGGIAEACDNMQAMCLEVGGYVKKVEQTIKDLEEELERA